MSFTSILPAAAAASSGLPFGLDPLTIGLVLLLVVMVVFMIRNSRKRRRDAEELKNKFVVGAEVMTQHGIYGTIVSIDDEKNEAVIETTPGTRLRVHRQVIARVVEPSEIAPEKDVVADETPDAAESTGAPAYGERIAADQQSAADEKPAAAAAAVEAPAVAPKPATRTRATSTTPRSTAAKSTSTTRSTTAAKSSTGTTRARSASASKPASSDKPATEK